MVDEKRKALRCAIYTRKSTEEGLEQEFNSLDAQREAGENYVHSQKSEGWQIIPTRYDDGGFTGSNMERPALKRLLADIECGRIDCVVVYKVDRLSRSLLDFTTLVNAFDRHSVTFVSVTQAFNTTTSMGRLTLNILLSFAQFEREIIGERIRDKIAAAKRKGKHTGGMPILGYDLVDGKLVINPAEAKTVRHMFRRFLVLRSPFLLAKELNEQGISTKAWTTRKGRVHPGGPWNKSSVYKLITNRKYIGEITHHRTIYEGEQDAIIDQKTWEQAQDIFRENSHARANVSRSRGHAILKGILKCGHCGGAMGITYTRKKGRTYRYYHCIAASKNGYDTCPVRSVPAGDIEAAVVDRLRGMLRTPEILAQAHRAMDSAATDLPDQKAFAAALQDIDAVWEHLFPLEQARICRLLLERVIVNPDGMDVRLRSCGITLLVGELRGIVPQA